MLSFILFGYYYAGRVAAGTIDRASVNALVVRIVAALACLLSIATIVVMSKWAQNNPTDPDSEDVMYLGKPDMSNTSGIFAYHPVLMTSGFFVAQIFAISAWSLGRVRENAKLAHVICQTAGVSTMIAGYYAIMEYQDRSDSATLSTIHSWVGIMAVATFGLTYLWGATMAFLLLCFPGSVLRQGIDLRWHHRKLGVYALILSLAAVLTGVMNQLPRGQCANGSGYDIDGSKTYVDMPESCKLGLGVGVLVCLAVMFALWAVADRGESFAVAPATSPTNQNSSDSSAKRVATAVPIPVGSAPPYEYATVPTKSTALTSGDRQYMQVEQTQI